MKTCGLACRAGSYGWQHQGAVGYSQAVPRSTPSTVVRIEFHQKLSLARFEREDRWTLLADQQTGAKTVEHREIYRDPDSRRTISEQTKIYSLDEFALTEIGSQLQAKLAAAIQEASRLPKPR